MKKVQGHAGSNSKIRDTTLHSQCPHSHLGRIGQHFIAFAHTTHNYASFNNFELYDLCCKQLISVGGRT
jgi:hypothetical protein